MAKVKFRIHNEFYGVEILPNPLREEYEGKTDWTLVDRDDFEEADIKEFIDALEIEPASDKYYYFETGSVRLPIVEQVIITGKEKIVYDVKPYELGSDIMREIVNGVAVLSKHNEAYKHGYDDFAMSNITMGTPILLHLAKNGPMGLGPDEELDTLRMMISEVQLGSNELGVIGGFYDKKLICMLKTDTGEVYVRDFAYEGKRSQAEEWQKYIDIFLKYWKDCRFTIDADVKPVKLPNHALQNRYSFYGAKAILEEFSDERFRALLKEIWK